MFRGQRCGTTTIAVVRRQRVKANSHLPYRAPVLSLACRVAKTLECVVPILFTQCERV